MKTVVITKTVEEAGLRELLTARTEPMIERDAGDGVFELEDGPFEHYRRVVTHEATGEGTYDVTQTTDFVLAIPVWGWMFTPMVKKAIKDPPKPGQQLWWLPPDRMDRRATEVLARLCVFSVFAGYFGVLLSQLNTYFKTDFALSNSDSAAVAMAVRVAGLFALGVVAFADRRGRKIVLIVSCYAAIAFSVTGAFAPNIYFFGTTQTLMRTFSAAIGLLLGVMAAEEMPRGARAFAVSMLVASGAVGAGGVVVFLHLADASVWAWRIFLLVPLLMIIPVRTLAQRLPESRRFEVHELNEQRKRDGAAGAVEAVYDHEHAAEAVHSEAVSATITTARPPARMRDSHGFRFVVLATSAFLGNVFFAPAGYFFNDFLRVEQGYDGLKISLLQVLTNVPGGLSMIVGGRLAESRGRRIIGAIGMVGGFGFTVLMFLATGWGLWLYSTLGTLIGAIAIPALGVYGAELFPTGNRALAGGGLNFFGVIGGALGLMAAGAMSGDDHYGSYGPAMAVLGLGPLVVVFLVLFLYPETAHRELEELNPEDAPPPHDPASLARLDADYAVEHALHEHGHA